MASGQYLSMNPPEMIVDDIYNAGCFEIADKTLLGDEVTFVDIEGKVILLLCFCSCADNDQCMIKIQ